MVKGEQDCPTVPEPSAHRDGALAPARQLGFVVLASGDVPARIGAFIAVPASAGTWIFGRGGPRADDEYARLSAVMQRPQHNVRLPPFENTSLSRLQLRVTRRGNSLALVNVGKCPVAVNGVQTQNANVTVGDVVEVGRQLALLCVERPEKLNGESATHEFGEPDESGIVGESVAIDQLRREIAFVAMHTGHVLILGGSGTGKELVAAAIHRLSRPGMPWVSRNASTFPETLIDAELYGNARGYPNVGAPERKGLIGTAHQGSLFLDEFAELPISAQTHLLRVLDAGEYQRLGEASARRSDFRLIAATNQATSTLRLDIKARFVFQIRVPELSERREDIALLARHWLRTFAEQDPAIARRFFERGEPRLTADFVARLTRLPLEGNARELRNVLWQAIASTDTDELALASEQAAPQSYCEPEVRVSELQAALEANQGSLEKTWRALGLSSRFALMRLMKKNAVQIRKQARGPDDREA